MWWDDELLEAAVRVHGKGGDQKLRRLLVGEHVDEGVFCSENVGCCEQPVGVSLLFRAYMREQPCAWATRVKTVQCVMEHGLVVSKLVEVVRLCDIASILPIIYDPLTSSLIAGSVYVLLHFLTRVLITRNRLAIFFMCFWDPSNTNMWLFALPSSDSSDSTGSSSNSKRMYQSLYSSIALLQDDQGAARGPQYKTFKDAQGSSCYLFL